jgi:hypothetical protein
MSDVLGNREQALKDYKAAIALEPDSTEAALARRFVKEAFRF